MAERQLQIVGPGRVLFGLSGTGWGQVVGFQRPWAMLLWILHPPAGRNPLPRPSATVPTWQGVVQAGRVTGLEASPGTRASPFLVAGLPPTLSQRQDSGASGTKPDLEVAVWPNRSSDWLGLGSGWRGSTKVAHSVALSSWTRSWAGPSRDGQRHLWQVTRALYVKSLDPQLWELGVQVYPRVCRVPECRGFQRKGTLVGRRERP